MRSAILLGILVLFFGCRDLPKTVPSITAEDLEKHIQILADDNMQGRLAGSQYELASAKYIAARFEQYGLQPLTDDYFQTFDFVSGVKPGNNNRLLFEGIRAPFVYDVHFKTLGFSSSDDLTAPLVFAGYGIYAASLQYDDFAQVDVDGKAVIILRYSPDGSDTHGKFYEYSAMRKKAVIAREKGAAAVIFVTGEREDQGSDVLRSLAVRGANSPVGIPVIHAKRDVVDQWLKVTGHDNLSVIQQRINNDGSPEPDSFDIGRQVTISTSIKKEIGTSRNVIGALTGSGTLKSEWLVIGGHYDHLGMGGPNTNSMVPELHEIHNGADDNASGTAGVLELAEYFANMEKTGNQRSILFIGFGSEEVGLLGSSYYVANPLVPLEATVAMFNMDMIGRPKENQIIVGGAGTSSIWRDLISEQNSYGFNITFNDEGYASSDHQSFYLKDIPVLFFFTGAHEDYHRPSDDIEKINFPGIEQVVRLVDRAATAVIHADEAPEFQKVDAPSRPVGGRGYSVTIGIIPDFAYNGEGLRISAARENAPAGKAGLQGGDVIVSFNNITILNIQDYMVALSEAHAGLATPITIQRGSQALNLTVTPQAKEE